MTVRPPAPPPLSPAPLAPPAVPRLPEGTRDVLPAEYRLREQLRRQLGELFGSWGYRGVELPALEYASSDHPLDSRAFKLIDTGGQVLALRSEFTTALGRLVQTHFPAGPFPLRLHYGGRLWLRAQTSELGRLREFTQMGVELVGVSTKQADLELLELARAALTLLKVQAGVQADLEVGFPGFVDAVLTDLNLTAEARETLHSAIDRKSGADIELAARHYGLDTGAVRTLHQLTDLYGGPEVLAEAQKLVQGTQTGRTSNRAQAALHHLQQVAGRADFPLLFDLGSSRRYDYYTGMTFRAYSDGLNQPILGGGRYDLASGLAGGLAGGLPGGLGGGLPGAGFALGLERLAQVLALSAEVPPPETVLALDRDAAQAARNAGLVAELAWTDDPQQLRQYARQAGIIRCVRGADLQEVSWQEVEL